MWANFEQLKAAVQTVQEGVKEFSNVAISTVQEGVQNVKQQVSTKYGRGKHQGLAH